MSRKEDMSSWSYDKDANRFNGMGPNTDEDNAIRCQPLRERYYKCVLNTHLDKVYEQCEFWWDDYKECFAERKLIKKLQTLEEAKEAKLKAVGFKRPLWGGHQTEIFAKDHALAGNFGLPVPEKYEIGQKVNLSL